jgi:hypothetical protein
MTRLLGANRPAETVQNEFHTFMAELNGKSAEEVIEMANTLRKNSPQIGSWRYFSLLPKSIENSIPPERVEEFELFHIVCYALNVEEATLKGSILPADLTALSHLSDKTAYDIIGTGLMHVAAGLVADIPECAALESPNARDVCSLLTARKVLPALGKE